MIRLLGAKGSKVYGLPIRDKMKVKSGWFLHYTRIAGFVGCNSRMKFVIALLFFVVGIDVF